MFSNDFYIKVLNTTMADFHKLQINCIWEALANRYPHVKNYKNLHWMVKVIFDIMTNSDVLYADCLLILSL